jgi:hypothetical protein
MNFFVMPLKYVLSVMDLVNQSRTQNCGQQLMKMALKCKNDEFFLSSL